MPFAFCLASLPTVAPAKVSMASERLAFIDAAVNDAIGRGQTPGAVVLVARRGGVVWRKAYGSRALIPAREAMTADTVFDLASLTKVVATATSVMILVERGKVRLGDPVSLYIPELKGEGREKVTIEHLLTHRSGYAPDFDLGEQWAGYDEMLKHLYVEPLRSAPGARFVYSDINYITLGEVVRRASGETLDVFARRNIFEPLGMKDTGFRSSRPGPAPTAGYSPSEAAQVARIAPTENVRGMRSYLGGSGESSTAGEVMLRG
ncbi:MAG TPA: serine hydrolase domain-containing protein, partial [Pyrinomonadaceae bacterium]|nr:serine hydrolase domain-containing protein [Pyrinomonadaceae bacterium]